MVPPEEGGVAPTPEEPQKVLARLFFGRALGGVIALPGQRLRVVEKGPARELFAADGKFHEGAVVVHRDAAVIEQVAVVAFVKPALGVEEARVPLELLAAEEGRLELRHDPLLLGGEGVGVRAVDGGKLGVPQRVVGPSDPHGAVRVVDLVEQEPVVHAEFRVA